MAVQNTNGGAWIPSDEAHPGKTISTITTPTYDRQGGAMHITVTRPHFDVGTNAWTTIVLADVTDSTSVGFGARIVTISQPVTAGEPISISMQRTDLGVFAIDTATGAVAYV